MIYRLGQVLWWVGFLVLLWSGSTAAWGLVTGRHDFLFGGLSAAGLLSLPSLVAAFIITGHIWPPPPSK